ncbi:MAG: hypothetical protein QS721_05000 [Candidatus Endonucleobacter sp. (ex Gigantidas childressi)]|nr:hypothetical protein [Candidatus Endonucleobacter sp. (ex Gigantidas childressi)]
MPDFRTKEKRLQPKVDSGDHLHQPVHGSRELASNTGEREYRHKQAQGLTDRQRTESTRLRMFAVIAPSP